MECKISKRNLMDLSGEMLGRVRFGITYFGAHCC